jgi:hypothetical protein
MIASDCLCQVSRPNERCWRAGLIIRWSWVRGTPRPPTPLCEPHSLAVATYASAVARPSAGGFPDACRPGAGADWAHPGCTAESRSGIREAGRSGWRSGRPVAGERRPLGVTRRAARSTISAAIAVAPTVRSEVVDLGQGPLIHTYMPAGGERSRPGTRQVCRINPLPVHAARRYIRCRGQVSDNWRCWIR